ncbi:serine hydrolase domain-containing protein [Cellvibrio sp. ARAG 10.3]|uniref:serine hydrolase domain-containing protein n=1 Tax=Cellvibrio sp. ARAG 10.3 TaxID=3451358 RepID=UPI003F47EA84
MKTSKRPVWLLKIIMAIVSISCIVIFVPWLAACAYLAPLPDTVQKQVDDAINYNLDGIIVYVDIKGQNPEFYSSGWKNRENKVPADPHTLFKIGSISKLYIAAATAKLVSDQRLSLDEILTDYLPELDGRIENANKITLRMLLQHRSGIPDWIEDSAFPWSTSLKNVNEYLELVFDDPAEFDPDSRYGYSNTNYLLIGNILDKTLGYDHQQYIQSEILAPLGLTHTFGVLSDVDPGKVSSGYYTKYDGDVKMLDIVVPGGSMIATAEDTGIFLRALNDGSLFDDDERDIYSSIYVYEHTGLWPGYSSIARYHKDIDAVVIQFVNTSGGNSWMISEIVYNRIVQILRKR